MAAREPFAKVAAGLDSNRKIVKAGRNGRDVYLWVLRLVAQRSTAGVVPAEDVQDIAFASRQLMCSEDEAREGVERAVLAKLIRFSRGQCYVVGWDEEWGRRPLTGAERAARYRTADSNGAVVTSNDDVTEAPSLVTASVTRNAVEESRGEERRGERSLLPLRLLPDDPCPPEHPEPALEISAALCDALNAALGKTYRPDTEATLDLARALVRRRSSTTADEVRRVVEAKVTEWRDDADSSKWLRPSTLLAYANFTKYLVELDEGGGPAPARWKMPEY